MFIVSWELYSKTRKSTYDHFMPFVFHGFFSLRLRHFEGEPMVVVRFQRFFAGDGLFVA